METNDGRDDTINFTRSQKEKKKEAAKKDHGQLLPNAINELKKDIHGTQPKPTIRRYSKKKVVPSTSSSTIGRRKRSSKKGNFAIKQPQLKMQLLLKLPKIVSKPLQKLLTNAQIKKCSVMKPFDTQQVRTSVEEQLVILTNENRLWMQNKVIHTFHTLMAPYRNSIFMYIHPLGTHILCSLLIKKSYYMHYLVSTTSLVEKPNLSFKKLDKMSDVSNKEYIVATAWPHEQGPLLFATNQNNLFWTQLQDQKTTNATYMTNISYLLKGNEHIQDMKMIYIDHHDQEYPNSQFIQVRIVTNLQAFVFGGLIQLYNLPINDMLQSNFRFINIDGEFASRLKITTPKNTIKPKIQYVYKKQSTGFGTTTTTQKSEPLGVSLFLGSVIYHASIHIQPKKECGEKLDFSHLYPQYTIIDCLYMQNALLVLLQMKTPSKLSPAIKLAAISRPINACGQEHYHVTKDDIIDEVGINVAETLGFAYHDLDLTSIHPVIAIYGKDYVYSLKISANLGAKESWVVYRHIANTYRKNNIKDHESIKLVFGTAYKNSSGANFENWCKEVILSDLTHYCLESEHPYDAAIYHRATHLSNEWLYGNLFKKKEYNIFRQHILNEFVDDNMMMLQSNNVPIQTCSKYQIDYMYIESCLIELTELEWSWQRTPKYDQFEKEDIKERMNQIQKDLVHRVKKSSIQVDLIMKLLKMYGFTDLIETISIELKEYESNIQSAFFVRQPYDTPSPPANWIQTLVFPENEHVIFKYPKQFLLLAHNRAEAYRYLGNDVHFKHYQGYLRLQTTIDTQNQTPKAHEDIAHYLNAAYSHIDIQNVNLRRPLAWHYAFCNPTAIIPHLEDFQTDELFAVILIQQQHIAAAKEDPSQFLKTLQHYQVCVHCSYCARNPLQAILCTSKVIQLIRTNQNSDQGHINTFIQINISYLQRYYMDHPYIWNQFFMLMSKNNVDIIAHAVNNEKSMLLSAFQHIAHGLPLHTIKLSSARQLAKLGTDNSHNLNVHERIHEKLKNQTQTHHYQQHTCIEFHQSRVCDICQHTLVPQRSSTFQKHVLFHCGHAFHFRCLETFIQKHTYDPREQIQGYRLAKLNQTRSQYSFTKFKRRSIFDRLSLSSEVQPSKLTNLIALVKIELEKEKMLRHACIFCDNFVIPLAQQPFEGSTDYLLK